MRAFLILALIGLVPAGCATPIPTKDDFGASALVAGRDVPPGFSEFNRFDPAANDYIADQICATPHLHLQENAMPATPGRFGQMIARCRTHVPIFGS